MEWLTAQEICSAWLSPCSIFGKEYDDNQTIRCTFEATSAVCSTNEANDHPYNKPQSHNFNKNNCISK